MATYSALVNASEVIQSARPIRPMCYGWSTPDIPKYAGWTKIGYTEKQTVEARIKQQASQMDVTKHIEWKGSAVYDDGSGETFTDHDFHRYLEHVHHIPRGTGQGKEWFHVDGQTSRDLFYDFRARTKYTTPEGERQSYTLRDEQARAVNVTASHFESKGYGSQFLWNAKPRFGKTLAAYDLVKKMGFEKVLVLTNRPAISHSWADDFQKFMSGQVPLRFVSDNDSLKNHPMCHSYDEHMRLNRDADDDATRDHGFIAFESLQGLKGSMYFGGGYDKLRWMSAEQGGYTFDLVILDESHEGVDTLLTDHALGKIARKHTLHLSGTPFKALAGDTFSDAEIFNWSYADEQESKERWDAERETANPYAALPRLNMFTYQISPMLADTLSRGTTLEDGTSAEWAFDLNEFFTTNEADSPKFTHEDSVRAFLDSLTTGDKYPFSTDELRAELKHTLWILDRVASAKALAKMLKDHPVFKDYTVVLAAGDGKTSDGEATSKKAIERVRTAIATHERTITLSVGQLTVGVTVPQWSGVLMLCNWKSPAAYMQAAFRAQNPYEYQEEADGTYWRKENAYLFDFDPARTLTVYDEFAANLASSTRRGGGTAEDRRANITRLLNFFPVIGEDEDGQMIELDAHKVLSIPRKLKSTEVVRAGFMCNYLFANIHNIFSASGAMREIIEKLEPAKEAKKTTPFNEIDGIDNMHLGPDGEVDVPEEIVIGQSQKIFGDKIYETTARAESLAENHLASMLKDASAGGTSVIDRKAQKTYIDTVMGVVKNDVITTAQSEIGGSSRDAARFEKKVKHNLEAEFEKNNKNLEQAVTIAKADYKKAMKQASSDEEKRAADKARDDAIAQAQNEFFQAQTQATQRVVEQSHTEATEEFEHRKEERIKREGEETFRAHLRGFSRTIPSFIMAYGNENMTLKNFDSYTDDDVFKELTGITEEEFCRLRDGYWEVDSKSGERVFHKTEFFDETVFNDSIREFLKKKRELADYFNEAHTEDIFHYIPPQKTNQIFVPRSVVRTMVDALEAENPGCFDNPDHTFADLHIKSGMYITEIVKRLYKSEKMREVIPDDNARLHHIFTKQIYAIAPTEIIYRIAMEYILGFNPKLRSEVEKIGHIVKADSEGAAKDGTLPQLVEELFGQP